MKAKITWKIHNIFRTEIINAKTQEVIQEFEVENIVLDRIYSRLLNYQSYFDYIVFGTGSGTPVVTGSTLFNRLGYKSAVTEELVRDYPLSKWTKMIELGTEEYNGYRITEVGISNETTNVNTHAMLIDAEGNPLMTEEKTNLMIIRLYATVFIEVFSVDTGLYWYSNGFRDYLTGTGSAGNVMGISNLREMEIATQTGTKVVDLANKSFTLSRRFNVGDLNKDVRFLYWTSGGLACEVPRPGVTEGEQINNLEIGVGDGETTVFSLKRTPNTPLENLVVMVDGSPVDFTHDDYANTVTLDIAPASTTIVTASYKSLYIPKTVDNVLDVDIKIQFAVSEPSPVVPDPEPYIPGATVPIAGDLNYGFFGEVYYDDLINGVALANRLGLTVGTIQNTTEPWLKFVLDGKTLFVAKKTLRHSISWDQINAVNAVYGNKEIVVNGHTYKVRLLKTGLIDPMSDYQGNVLHGSEWNKLMLPIHEQAANGNWAYPNNVEAGIPDWGIGYTDQDLLTSNSFGSGSYSWCQETYSSSRMVRGYSGVSRSYNIGPSGGGCGWRPVLELVA